MRPQSVLAFVLLVCLSYPALCAGQGEAAPADVQAVTAAWRQWLASPEGQEAAQTVVALPQDLWQAMPTDAPDREFAMALARGAWGYLDAVRDAKSGLPLDRFDLDPPSRPRRRTSLNNLGLHLACLVAARELGFLATAEVTARLGQALDGLDRLEGDGGNAFEWFCTETLRPESRRVSAVALGWLAAGLMVTRMACDDADTARRCEEALRRLNFAALYDEGAGLFRGHLDLDLERRFSAYHNGCFASETRITSYCAIALGQVPPSQLFRTWRIAPWQRDANAGSYRSYLGVSVWEQPIRVPGGVLGARSWGGALFEALMPTLMVDEARLAPRGLGANNRETLRIHIAHAARTGVPVWGVSPCAVPGSPGGRSYGEFGVPEAGTSGAYGTGVVTPHAAALALSTDPEAALGNLRKMLGTFPALCGPFGPYDAVDTGTGQVARTYLALDESMILLSIANHLRDGCIQKAFESYPGVRERLVPALALEDFGL
jgi:hypothetical protein